LAYATTNGHRIEDILPCREAMSEARRRITLFVEAVLYRFRTGIPWRDLSARFGSRSVHQRFGCLGEERGFERIFQLSASEADNEYTMIDATVVPRSSTRRQRSKKDGDQAIGRSRGGLTTKIHVRVDALGNPANRMLTAGQIHYQHDNQ
jgi:hypothetical protein